MKNLVILLCLFILTTSFNLYADAAAEIFKFENLSYPIIINVTEKQAVQTKTNGILFLSTKSKKTHIPYNTVLINGLATNEKWQLEISYFKNDNSWSDWKPVFKMIFKNGRYWA
jgi:hypothetical protein